MKTLSDTQDEILAQYKRYLLEKFDRELPEPVEGDLHKRIGLALECFPSEYVDYEEEETGKLWHRMCLTHIGGIKPSESMAVLFDLCEDGRLSIYKFAAFGGSKHAQYPRDARSLVLSDRSVKDNEVILAVQMMQAKAQAGNPVAKRSFFPRNLFQTLRIGDSLDVAESMAGIITQKGIYTQWYKKHKPGGKYHPVARSKVSGRGLARWREMAKADFVAVIQPIVHERRREIFTRFFAHLPPEQLKAMLRLREYDKRTYDWLMADGDEQKQWRRLQASGAAPGFMRWMTGSHDRGLATGIVDGRGKLLHGLRDVINGQNDTQNDTQSDTLNVQIDRATVKRLSTVSHPRDLPDKVNYFPGHFLRFAQSLPKELHPDSAQGWHDLLTLQSRVDMLAFSLGVDSNNLFAEIAHYDKRIIQYLAKSTTQVEQDIKDWRERLTRTLLIPHLHWAAQQSGLEEYNSSMFRNFADDLGRELMKDAGTMDKLKASQEWHDRVAYYEGKLATIGLDQMPMNPEWLPLSKPMTAPNGVRIAPITSPAGLRALGTTQRHCVGGYAGQCLTDVHVMAFEDKNGELTTGHFKETGKVGSIKLVRGEHKAERNKAPPKAHAESYAWYLKYVNANPPDWQNIRSVRNRLMTEMRACGIDFNLGFNPEDPTAPTKVYEVNSPFFPTTEMRKLSHGEWLEATDIMGKIRKKFTQTGWLMQQQSRMRELKDRIRVNPRRALVVGG